MERKGFPESYDTGALLRFLADIKAGQAQRAGAALFPPRLRRCAGRGEDVDLPDILIVEGLNVLQPARMPKDGMAIPFVSDFFDFSVYIDAEEDDLHRWYVNRFLRLRHTAFRDPLSYFRRYAELSRGGGDRHRRGPVDPHQPDEPAGKHRADAPARQPDPEKGRQPPHRGGGAQAAVMSASQFFMARVSSRTTARKGP